MNETIATLPTVEAVADQQFRSQVGHISRQSGVFFAGTIFTAALGYVFKVYLARVLGAENLGLYALGLTLTGFVGIFNMMGLHQSAVRFVAAYQAAGKPKELHAFLWGGGGLLLAANIALAVILLLFGPTAAVRMYHSPALVPYLPLFALIMLFGSLNSFYGKVLAGYRDLKWRTLIVNFLGSPLNMLIAVLLIAAGMQLRGYMLAQVLSTLMVGLMLLAAVRRFTPAAARFRAQTSFFPRPEVWSFSAAMLGIGSLEFIMGQVDKIALGYYSNAREVGIYSIAAAVVVYVPLVLSSVNQIFAPTIADLHTRHDRAMLARLFQSLTKWVVGLTLPLALVIIIFARPLMRIFGHDFEVGWPVLIIGTVGQLVNCAVGSVGFLLLMSGNQKRFMKVLTVMTAVMVVLSVALIPRWGIVGAALAAAATNVGVNVWNLLEVRAALGLTPYNRGYLRLFPPTLAALAMILVLRSYSHIFHRDWLAVGTAFALAYAVFVAVAFMMRLDADDRLIADAMWARIRDAFVRRPEAEA